MTRKQPKQSLEDFLREATSGLALTPGVITTRFKVTPAPMAETTPDDTKAMKGAQSRDNGVPTEEDMGYINKLARSPLDPEMLYAFDCAPSTQRVDSYLTSMDVSSLENYAIEAMLGIPVMNSHRTGGWTAPAQLPLGRSFWGGVEADPQLAGKKRFVASSYMLRNNKANGEVNTDDIIAGIEAGTISDISIGFRFKPGTPENDFKDRTWYRCSCCGQDWLMSDPWEDGEDACRHWPGEIYDGQLCYLQVMNAHLNEFSTVYSGATDGAVILKTKRAIEAGTLSRAQIHNLEGTYRTRLIGRSKLTTLKSAPPKEGAPNTERGSMATKKVDTAREDGAKEALVRLVQQVVESRSLSEAELKLVEEIQSRLAAGELTEATALITELATGARAEGEESEESEVVRGVEGDEDEEGEDNRTSPSVSLISLDARERQQYRDLQEEASALRREVKKLAPLAAIGERYRDQVIEATVRAAIKANLEDTTEADVLRMCQRLDIEDVERLYRQYSKQAAERLGNFNDEGQPMLIGGRQTVAGDPNVPALRGVSASPKKLDEKALAAYQ